MGGVNVMATRDNEKKSRIARDFRRVLIVLVITLIQFSFEKRSVNYS